MKTYLSQDKLLAFKDRLLQMKKETEDALEANTTSEPNENLQKFADYSNHPANMGTEQFEQQKKAGLRQQLEEQLQEIDDALTKMEDGTFGLSEKSEKPIPLERLEAQLTARNLVGEDNIPRITLMSH
jgi:DnaK suppressor protein